MAVGGVDHEQSTPASISALARSKASGPVPTAAATRRRPWASLVASGKSIFFWMSLTVMRPESTAVGVDDGQLLDAVLAEDGLGLLERGAHRGGDQALLGHDLADALVDVVVEAQVAVGEDADQAVGRRR